MKNQEIAQLFEHTADVLAVAGANSFRVLAYRKVARLLEELPEAIEQIAEEADRLEELPGVGKASAEKIREYLRTGKIGEFQDIWSSVPEGVLAIMKIPTVGPKTAAVLWQEGGVRSIDELKTALEKGTLTGLPGIGEKKLAKIKTNLEFLSTTAGRIRLGEALPLAESFVDFIRKIKGVQEVCYCGSLRRGKETIGDIDIAVSADDKTAVKIGEAVAGHPSVAEVIGSGKTKTSIRTTTGIQVDVRVVPPESFGAAVQYFTGSKEHNVKMREIAAKKGMKLNEWGLEGGENLTTEPPLAQRHRGDDEKKIKGVIKAEREIYHALGLSYIPPEMREDRGEIEYAIEEFNQQRVDIVLVEQQDIRGDLHMHTNASDGSCSIEEMVAECKRRGYQYCAITDHSKSQFQANGLKTERLLEHIKAIHAVAKEAWRNGKGILVLAGSEVDILADGSLDYEDDLLAKLDWVVASPHAALTQDPVPATQRLVRACANPYVCVIGHPTGRLVPQRKGLEMDMQKIIFAAARNGVAMELNANYHRLDLRDTHLKMARDAGVPICIDTDAHSFEDLDQMPYGIMTARRGWLAKEHVLNTLPVGKFQAWLKNKTL